jgi:hypothetical protein
MTAFGLAMMAISFFGAWYDEVMGLSEKKMKAVGFIGFVGLVSFVSGVLIWIWRVMP